MMKNLRDGDDETNIDIGNKISLRAGFEPARENPIGFRVQRLNHSAITAPQIGPNYNLPYLVVKTSSVKLYTTL